MALQIILSTSTARLIGHLVESLDQPGDAGVLRPVLLPSRPLVERVRMALARRMGVAMGVEFLLPAAFLDRLGAALGLPPLDPAWSPEGLFWRLLPQVEALRELPRLRAACRDPRARLALARQVADRFDQYLHFRPEMIEAWDAGKPWKELPEEAREDEAWQRRLWQALKAAAGEAEHPAQRLRRLSEEAGRADPACLGGSVEVLSTGPLPKPLLRVLAAFGRCAEVKLRCLLPSVEYLGEIETKRTLRLRGEDPDPNYQVHDLLAQQGRQAVETFQSLSELDESGQALHYLDEPAVPGPRSLLKVLQDDIRAARPPAPEQNPPEELPQAAYSLCVHRCHGARREVEVLRDALLEAFERDPQLKPEEVLILAPDLETYGPLAQALLPQAQPPLPLRLAERRLEGQDALFQALLALLRFVSGRATLSEGLGLLELEAVRARLGAEAAEELLQRLPGSGITFGLDAEHRRALGAGDESSGTWRAGLDRLLAGQWMGDEAEAVDLKQEALLPLAGALGGGGDWIRALDWLATLLELARAWREEAAPAEWARRLDEARRRLLALGPDDDTAVVAELLGRLEAAQNVHGCRLNLDAARLLDWMEWQGLDESRTVAPVGGAMALGGFKPLRALPCKVLAVLGLSDAAFPRRSQNPAWDLMAAKPMPGDRDPRKEDRQLFLDALLAAEQQVILTAPARNVRTDQQEPLSVCVDELLRAALDSVPAESRAAWQQSLLRDHSLQPFHPSNFLGPRPSYDESNLRLAQALQRPRRPQAFAEKPLPAAGTEVLDIVAVLQVLKKPAAAFLRRLDLSPPHDPEDPAEQDAEPADLDDPLLRWQLYEAALRGALYGSQAFLLERLQADRSLPYGRLGRAGAEQPLLEARQAARRLLQHCKGLARRVFTLEGDALTGSVEWDVAADGSALLGFHASTFDKAGLQLQLYAQAASAAAAGTPLPSLVLARERKGEKKFFQLNHLPALSTEQAHGWLQDALRLARSLAEAPPCFEPEMSRRICRDFERSGSLDQALAAARLAWEELGGGLDEAGDPTVQWVWRGLDPFAPPRDREWLDWALRLWKPVLEWVEKRRPVGEEGGGAEAPDGVVKGKGPAAAAAPRKKSSLSSKKRAR